MKMALVIQECLCVWLWVYNTIDENLPLAKRMAFIIIFPFAPKNKCQFVQCVTAKIEKWQTSNAVWEHDTLCVCMCVGRCLGVIYR